MSALPSILQMKMSQNQNQYQNLLQNQNQYQNLLQNQNVQKMN